MTEEELHFYKTVEKVLENCYFCSMSTVDFFNVAQSFWFQTEEVAEVYRTKFVERTKKRHIPEHANFLINLFDAKVQEVLAQRHD